MSESSSTFSTLQAARLLGLAVRSVQLMVDRGELQAWKTPGGHRRISAASLDTVLRARGLPALPGLDLAAQVPDAALSGPLSTSAPRAIAASAAAEPAARVLLIEDSVHFQNLVRLLVGQRFPQVELHVAADGIAGLALFGQLRPQVLLVDVLLPGIDGATLITSLRSQPQFAGSHLIVVTSLDEAQRAPYALALAGLPVIHKPDLALQLPLLLQQALQAPAVSSPRLAA